MKGLLIKDMRLMKSQGGVLVGLVLLVAVFVGVMTDLSPLFTVAYITIFLSIYTTTTISYDEFDNGYSFLMTLPITREKYVNEKYVFGIIITLFAWCMGMTAGTVLLIAEKIKTPPGEWIGSNLMYICFGFIFISFMVPLRLKFDAEKARYANVIIVGVIIAASYGITRLLKHVPGNMLRTAREFFEALGDNGILALFAVAAAAAMLISYLCSRRIMERKEF